MFLFICCDDILPTMQQIVLIIVISNCFHINNINMVNTKFGQLNQGYINL